MEFGHEKEEDLQPESARRSASNPPVRMAADEDQTPPHQKRKEKIPIIELARALLTEPRSGSVSILHDPCTEHNLFGMNQLYV